MPLNGSIEMFTGRNFYSWSAGLKGVALGKECWDVRLENRSLTSAPVDGETGYRDLSAADMKLQGYMLQSVAAEFKQDCARAESAIEVYMMLKRMASKQSVAGRKIIEQQLAVLHKHPEEIVDAYFTRGKELFRAWADSNEDGRVMELSQQREKLLSGMPPDYAIQVEVLNQREVGPALDICADVLRSRESLIALEGSAPALAFAAQQCVPIEARLSYHHQPSAWSQQHMAQQGQHQPALGWSPAPHGFAHAVFPQPAVGQQQYLTPQTPPPGWRPQMPMQMPQMSRASARVDTCSNCNQLGHRWRHCTKLTGLPLIPALQKQRDFEEARDARRKQARAATATEWSNNIGASKSWLLDSGATSHMCHDHSCMHNIRDAPGWTVVCATGHIAPVKGVGTAVVQLLSGPLQLHDVLLVPSMTTNLLSIGSLTRAGIAVHFIGAQCELWNGNHRVHVAMCHDRQYTICGPPSATTAMAVDVAAPAALWHRRLGHAGLDRLIRLAEHGMVTGMPVTAAEFRRMRDQFCETCTLTKLHRSPFPTSASTSARPLQLLHVDLCGPYTTPTPLGSRYALVVLDDYSKFAFVRELKLKSDASPAIQHLVQECETRFHHERFVVQSVRSDKGGEFEHGQLLSFYRAKGIRHETTVGYAPQQNGAAERLVQTLNSMARALHHDALLPPEQWGQSMRHAAWIRNRLPAAGTGDKTPFELFMGAKPDLSNLHVYGSPSYALVQQPHVRKMADRAEPGRYMGVGSAGTLFLPRGAHKCVERCHVRVVETAKPLAGTLWQQHECDAAEPHVCPWAILMHGSTGTSGLGKPALALPL
jgi:transposase InsO family protein